MITQQTRTALSTLAHGVADDGTLAHRGAIEALADTIRDAQPAVAIALTDWDGTEVARLRAFGLAHRTMRFELEEDAREAFVQLVRPAREYRLTA